MQLIDVVRQRVIIGNRVYRIIFEVEELMGVISYNGPIGLDDDVPAVRYNYQTPNLRRCTLPILGGGNSRKPYASDGTKHAKEQA